MRDGDIVQPALKRAVLTTNLLPLAPIRVKPFLATEGKSKVPYEVTLYEVKFLLRKNFKSFRFGGLGYFGRLIFQYASKWSL